MFNFLKNNIFLQNLIIKFLTFFHPAVNHNIGKVNLIKNAIYFSEIEKIEGSYYEFGIYNGSSLYAALKSYLYLNSKIKRNFYGFDSFDEGFKYFINNDKHDFFKEGDFTSSYKLVKNRFKKYDNVKLIKGYFEDTLTTSNQNDISGSDKCAIIFIDCDLMNPSIIALNFIKPLLQKGTIIILDDFWSYKADSNLGVAGAFNYFLKENSNIIARKYMDYGIGGTSFIIENL